MSTLQSTTTGCVRRLATLLLLTLVGLLSAVSSALGLPPRNPPPGDPGDDGGGRTLSLQIGPRPQYDAEGGTYWSSNGIDRFLGQQFSHSVGVRATSICPDGTTQNEADMAVDTQLSDRSIWPSPGDEYSLRLTYIPYVPDNDSDRLCQLHTFRPTFNLGEAFRTSVPIPRCYQGSARNNSWQSRPCHAVLTSNDRSLPPLSGNGWGQAWTVILDLPEQDTFPAWTDPGEGVWQIYLPVQSGSNPGVIIPTNCGSPLGGSPTVCQRVSDNWTYEFARYRVDVQTVSAVGTNKPPKLAMTSNWQVQGILQNASAAAVIAQAGGLAALGLPGDPALSSEIVELEHPDAAWKNSKLYLFQHSALVSTTTGGGHILPAQVFNAWFMDAGQQPGYLGIPVSDSYVDGGQLAQQFQLGKIVGNQACMSSGQCRTTHPWPLLS